MFLSLGRIERLVRVKYPCAFCPLLTMGNETLFKGFWMYSSPELVGPFQSRLSCFCLGSPFVLLWVGGTLSRNAMESHCYESFGTWKRRAGVTDSAEAWAAGGVFNWREDGLLWGPLRIWNENTVNVLKVLRSKVFIEDGAKCFQERQWGTNRRGYTACFWWILSATNPLNFSSTELTIQQGWTNQ